MTPNLSTEVKPARKARPSDSQRASREDTRNDARAIKRTAKQLLKAGNFEAVRHGDTAPMWPVTDATVAFTFGITGNSRYARGVGQEYARALGLEAVSFAAAKAKLTVIAGLSVETIVRDIKDMQRGDSIGQFYN